jgi:hypothetical protein
MLFMTDATGRLVASVFYAHMLFNRHESAQIHLPELFADTKLTKDIGQYFI